MRLGKIRDAAEHARFMADLRTLQRICEGAGDFPELRQVAAGLVYERANAAYRLKALGPAEELFLHALKIDPGHPQTLGNLVTLYQKRGDYPRAEAMLERFSAARDGALPLVLRGELLMAQGRFTEAAAAYRMALVRDPASVHAHGNLGICLFRLGQAPEAAASFREATRLDPWNQAARENLRRVESLLR
jgi:tetratricopeptide (TPR) repeat protein